MGGGGAAGCVVPPGAQQGKPEEQDRLLSRKLKFPEQQGFVGGRVLGP